MFGRGGVHQVEKRFLYCERFQGSELAYEVARAHAGSTKFSVHIVQDGGLAITSIILQHGEIAAFETEQHTIGSFALRGRERNLGRATAVPCRDNLKHSK